MKTTSTYLAATGLGLAVLAGPLAWAGLLGWDALPGAAAWAAAALGLGLGGAGAWGLTAACRRADARRAEMEAEAARLRALVQAAPDAWCAWGSQGSQAASPNFAETLGLSRPARLEDVETALAPGDAAALHGSFRHLGETGQPFRLTAANADGSRIFQVSGTRAEAPDGAGPGAERFDVLWLRDASATAAEMQGLLEGRQRAEAELEELRRALDQLPVPLWLRRPDLSIAWCNRAYAAAAGAGPAAVLARQLELPGAIGEPARALAARAARTRVAQVESRHVVVAGERRLLRLTEAPLPAADGVPPALAGVALDLTREAELRDELDRHLAAHAEVLEHLGSAIAIYGADTRLKFHNRAYARLWGLDAAWLETEPGYGEILEDLRARRKLTEQADFPRWKRDRLAQFTSLLEPQEDMIHLPDGTTLRSLSVPHPLGGLMFVLEDVTTTLALESSYNTLMAVQQETLDNLAEGVAVFGGDGRLKLSNPAFARIWRLQPDDLRGEPHLTQIVERLRPRLDGEQWPQRRGMLISGLLDRGAVAGRIDCNDGSVIQYTTVPLPDGAVLTSVLDVTDSVRVEEALRASNEALATADRLKSEFIANVSYQLRTPLNAIMGFAEILSNQYFGQLNDRQAEYARGVLEASRRLLALVNDILDLATIEAGFMVLERQEVDVAQLLNNVADLTRDWAGKRDLRLEVACPPDAGTVQADEKRLKQALFNLVSNAVKFTPAGGCITLSAARSDGEAVLAVSDTGVGIPPADQERVFGRFERAGAQSGAGLGLSLVKSFLELHGGGVEIDSRPGSGTTVRCRLPLTPPAPEMAEARDGAAAE
ncbi:MAG TPA: ATP-binding protein [Azospirillaceae bacterium]|nr:ATP-binding protein [Azospirillaceae bacterium]